MHFSGNVFEKKNQSIGTTKTTTIDKFTEDLSCKYVLRIINSTEVILSAEYFS